MSTDSPLPTRTPVLELQRLEIILGDRRLQLDHACRLTAGHIYLIVGPSGSGKSSFARALLGFGQLSDPLIECHAEVFLTDVDGNQQRLWRDAAYFPAAREKLAFLPQAEKLGFIDALSITENLRLFSALDRESADSQIGRLAADFRLQPVPPNLASASGGERIRLSAVRSLLPRQPSGGVPAVIIADEPTAALDRMSAQAMSTALVEMARTGKCVVLIITHEPNLFSVRLPVGPPTDSDVVRVIECPLPCDSEQAGPSTTVARLRMTNAPQQSLTLVQRLGKRASGAISQLGALALAPLAFLWGLLALHRPLFLLRQAVLDAFGPGTHAFSLVGCLLIAGTAAYFIFERLPKPELLDPLLLPEIMLVTGHTLVRVVLPLGACGLITTKLGAAQAARLAAAVRGGLLETLAMAGWRIEAYALVPAVIAQILAMAIGTLLALFSGIVLAGLVYVAGHDEASLSLTINLMIDGLDRAPEWWRYLAGKIAVSGFLGGSIAALSGIVPSQAKDDLARAVHRTLLWSVLAVLACQCAFVIAEFRP